jgi:hypothetical protein
MAINIIQWFLEQTTIVQYTLAIAAFFISFFLFIFLYKYLPRIPIRFIILRCMYTLLINWRYSDSVTYMQALVLLIYSILNGIALGLGIKDKSDFIVRCGIIASINMMLLYLGGRTSIIANYFQVSLHMYYLLHHWIGRIVILQGVLHAVLAISRRPVDNLAMPGIIVIVLLSASAFS